MNTLANREEFPMFRAVSTVTMVSFMILFSVSVGAKEDSSPGPASDAKELSGISIVGNKEAPKSLFIVPWKSSEIGVETSLSSSLLNEDLNAVDKEVFERELEFFYATTNED